MSPARSLSLACFGALVLGGCPSGGGEEPPPDSHAYYEGTVVATKPDGEPLGDPSVSLLRRSHLPADARIEDQVIELDDGGVPLEILASSTVVAADATYRTQYQDDFGVLEGFGALTAGEDWAWTAWEGQVEYTSGPLVGTTLRSAALLEGSELSIDTEVIGAGGDLEVIEVRTLSGVSEATFTARYAELLGD
jgi:hypothetical protein